MKQVITRTLLAGSGALLGVIGAAMLTKTAAFLAMSDVEIDPDPGLLSELKAPSVLLILAGTCMLVGSVRSRFADLGLAVGAVVYGSYGVARIAGMVIDGLPTGSLLIATLIELVLAALLMALRLSRPNAPQAGAQQPKAA
ncbi:DUF4345 domain-containing protein [Hyphomonas sp.]|uniref:DUF4345 domain-containing protein n=1 Tax=Hyphomonas sp. TaxID=87 RepID=UPI003D267971